MATAKNMKELNNMLMKQLGKAMNSAAKRMEADMYEQTGDFYTGKEPKKYQRTGALGDTPSTTAPTVETTATGGKITFDAYLDTSGNYTTGKNPSMKDVLNLANYGISPTAPNHLRATVGKKGFWERAEENMEKTLDKTMREYFD